MTAGMKSAPSRFNSLGRRMMSRACSHPCTRLNMLPLKMMRPTMNGKVPASTPAADQPIPLSMLETTTAAPNAPVTNAVPASRLRPETIIRTLVGDEPTLVGGNLVGALDVLLDEFAKRFAGEEGIGLRRPLNVFLPFRRVLNLLHQIDIERGLLRADLSRQPHRARLLE